MYTVSLVHSLFKATVSITYSPCISCGNIWENLFEHQDPLPLVITSFIISHHLLATTIPTHLM